MQRLKRNGLQKAGSPILLKSVLMRVLITGLIQNDKKLMTDYCNQIAAEFIRRKRDTLLSDVRSICLSRDYDYSIMEESLIRDGIFLIALSKRATD